MLTPDPTITETVVVGGRTAHVGDRARHAGQLHAAGSSTATIIGFAPQEGEPMQVFIDHDRGRDHASPTWDADRVILDPRSRSE